MPANYSVIAENEMTYVNGGASFIDAIGAVTAPIRTLDNVKTFSTNVVTIVGNAKLQGVVNNTLGYIFSGDANWKQLGQNLKGLFVAKNGHFGDSFATTLGTAAAVYNLGTATVANKAGDTVLFKGPAEKKAYKGSFNGKDFFITEA